MSKGGRSRLTLRSQRRDLEGWEDLASPNSRVLSTPMFKRMLLAGSASLIKNLKSSSIQVITNKFIKLIWRFSTLILTSSRLPRISKLLLQMTFSKDLILINKTDLNKTSKYNQQLPPRRSHLRNSKEVLHLTLNLLKLQIL